MMSYKSEVFMSQFPVVKRFVYHLIYYRTLSKAYSDTNIQNEFWTLTIDAHLLQATIYWCMVFGSDGCNPTHWKHLSPDQSETLHQSFRDGLFQQTGLDQQAWESYWKEIVNFRDNYAAHRALGFSSPVPYFDIAHKVVYYYDNWVRTVISPDIFDEPLLEVFAITLAQSVETLVTKLFEASKESS
jgi:hypothetical protein